MAEILQSHVISHEALKLDDFNKFFNHRQDALLYRIEKAMGKQINRQNITDDDDVNDITEEEIEISEIEE